MEENKYRFIKKKENICKLIYLFAFIDILAVDHISATSIKIVASGRMIQVGIFLLGIVVLLTHYSIKEWLGIVMAGVLGLISFIYTGNYFVCELALLLIAAKNIEKRLIIKVYLFFVGGLTALVGIASVVGLFGEMYQQLDFRGSGIETRYCMGYNHPNSYHIILIQLMLAVFLLYWKKIKWYHIAGCGIFNIIIFLFTKSRTNLLMGMILILLMLAGKFKPAFSQCRWIYLFNYVILLGSLVLSGLAVILSNTLKITEIVNRFWTNRIIYAYEVAYFSHSSFFSSPSLQVSCDMGFVKIWYNYGSVIFLAVLFLLITMIYFNYRKRDYVEMLCIFAGIIYVLGEKFSSGEFITRNLMFVCMLGWGTYESDKPEK